MSSRKNNGIPPGSRKRPAEGIVRERLCLDRNLQVIFCVTLMAVLGVSSIAPALPRIARLWNLSSEEAGWIIAVFTFPGVVLMPVLGFLADRWGRKKVLVPSLLLFSVAGTLCAFTRGFNGLLVMRFLQGVGAASLGTLNLTLIGDLYAGRERVEAMGWNAAVLSMGTAVYPALGGLLAMAAWNFPFLLSALALPVAFFTLQHLKNPEPEGMEKMRPYFPKLLKSVWQPQVVGLFGGMLTAFIIIYGTCLTCVPFFMKDILGASPATIGIFLSLMSLGTGLAAWRLRQFTEIFGPRRLILMGFGLYMILGLAIPWVSRLWHFVFPAVLFGMAHGVSVPSMHALLAELALDENRGAVMATTGMFLRLGQTVGPLLMASVYFHLGMRGAFLVSSLLSVATLVMVGFLLRKRRSAA